MAPGLARGERVLIREATADGGACAASDRALHYRAAMRPWERIGWEEIALVGRGRPDGLTRLYLWPGDRPATEPLLLPARSRLADFAAERVLASRLATRRVTLAPNCEATVSAVRIPGEDGVAWKVWFPPGQDATDPAISRAADLAVSALREQFGC
jgi:hypothetical protein